MWERKCSPSRRELKLKLAYIKAVYRQQQLREEKHVEARQTRRQRGSSSQEAEVPPKSPPSEPVYQVAA